MTRFRVTKIISGDKTVEVFGNLDQSFLGSPVFDSQGRIMGCITDTTAKVIKRPEAGNYEQFEVTSITELLKYATSALSGLDLYPIWKEVYPTEFTINWVKESVALLETKKGGAGIFLGRDKSENGYILTAYHVVSEEAFPFSVQFLEHYEEKILGETMMQALDKDLDLAIVKVDSCPAIKPITFMRSNDLGKLENLFTPQTIGTIGYDETTAYWRQKLGTLRNIADKTVETDLPLESGDSGGPIFDRKGEVLGLNLKTTTVDSTQQSILSISANSRAILIYLRDQLREVNFKEKWRFYHYPSFWSKNINWLLPSGLAGSAVAAVFFLRGNSGNAQQPTPLASHPEFP